jgi:clan AA aspartic protease (TIGR02281 family)
MPHLNLSLLIPVFMVGFVCGWLLRDVESVAVELADKPASVSRPPPQPANVTPTTAGAASAAGLQTIQRSPNARQAPAYLGLAAELEEDFEVLVETALLARSETLYAIAIDHLLRAALVVETKAQQQVLEAQLANVTDAYARSLISSQRYADLDRIYEAITLALPELGDYFMALGLLRIQTGDSAAALSALAQIENHGRLGAQARQLMADISSSSVDESAALEALPLILRGSQWLVKAELDNRESITLMIDTGAAMTVLQPQLLARLGYSLRGREAYFSTANGVVQAPVVAIQRLSLGQTGINQLSVGALELALDQSIDGLLGMNFLRHYQFRIDQDQEELVLERSRESP